MSPDGGRACLADRRIGSFANHGFETIDLEKTLSNRLTAGISIPTSTLLFTLALVLTSSTPESARAHKAHVKPETEEPKAPPISVTPELSPPLAEPATEAYGHGSELSTKAEAHEAEPSAKGHDHKTGDSSPESGSSEEGHEDAGTNVPQPLAWFGKFHPPVTHFPIALIVAAALAEFLFMQKGTALFEHATRFCVWLGAGGAVLAAILGWFFAGFHLFDDEWVMTTHRWLGTATALWAALIFGLCERAYSGTASRQPFRLALFAGAGLVSTTGFFGGALIYGLDHYWG